MVIYDNAIYIKVNTKLNNKEKNKYIQVPLYYLNSFKFAPFGCDLRHIK